MPPTVIEGHGIDYSRTNGGRQVKGSCQPGSRNTFCCLCGEGPMTMQALGNHILYGNGQPKPGSLEWRIAADSAVAANSRDKDERRAAETRLDGYRAMAQEQPSLEEREPVEEIEPSEPRLRLVAG